MPEPARARVIVSAALSFDGRVIPSANSRADTLDPRLLASFIRRCPHVETFTCDAATPAGRALIRSGLADEVHLTIRPLVVGGRALTLGGPPSAPFLPRSMALRLLEMRPGKEGECFLRYRVIK